MMKSITFPSGLRRTYVAWSSISLASPFVLIAFFMTCALLAPTAQAQAPTTAWTVRYNGTGNGVDQTVKTLADAAGNVYVVGHSDGDATAAVNNDIVLIKYNAAGVQQWLVRYNGPANGADAARDMALDGSGAVYVTGSSTVPGHDADMVLLKYTAAGTQAWVQYADAEQKEDVGNAMALDASGNVYVTGYITRSDTVDPGWGDEVFINKDYATWKYSSAGGLQWVKYYGTTGAFFTYYEKGNDIATKIAVDASGNVYIAGQSPDIYTGKCLLIKYSTDGVQQWLKTTVYGVSARMNGLALDPSGNICYSAHYIPGDYDGNAGFYTINTGKFTAAGNSIWFKGFGNFGYPDGDNQVTNIATDPSGNVYLIGARTKNGPYPGNGYLILKYSASGEESWFRTFQGVSGNNSQNEYTQALTVDTGGNVYVTGAAFYDAGGYNYATLKYDAAGAKLWEALYNGPGNGSDSGTSLALGPDGSLYVTGNSNGGASGDDFATIKYAFSAATVSINSFAPMSAPVGAGVAIRGSNFTAGSTVRFNGVAATQVSFESSSLLIATVPAGATSGSIQVSNANGTATSAGNLTVASATSLWEAKITLPTARTQHGAVALSSNGRVYAFGGTNGSELSSLEIYNTNAFSWTTGAPIPTPTRGAAFVRGTDNQIYLFSGYGGGSNRSQSYKYNPATNVWTALPSLFTPVWAASAAASGNSIYLFGGQTAAGTASDQVQIYNTQTNHWTSGAVMPIALMQAQTVTSYNGKIYLFGGRTAAKGGLSDRVLVYNSTTNSWSTAASMPVPKAQFGTVLNNDGRIFVVGGRGSYVPNQGPFFHSVEIFDPKANTWSEGPALPSAVGGQTVVNSYGNLFMMGGIDGVYRNYNWRLVLPPVAPTSAKATAISSSQIKVEWVDAAGNENRYEVERSLSATGPWTVIATTAANASTYTDGNRAASKTYFYRVRGGNSSGYGAYSPTVSATTWATGAIARESVEQEEATALRLQAAPNPFHSQTTVTFTAIESGLAVLDLYDLQGVKLQQVFQGEVQAGESQKAEVNGSGLVQGLYLLRLVNERQVQNLKILITK
jgi:hypothetical protein